MTQFVNKAADLFGTLNMATGVDPKEGGTIFTDALGTVQFLEARVNNGTVGSVVMPSSSISGNQTPSETPTSEHSGVNHEPAPSQAGTLVLATNSGTPTRLPDTSAGTSLPAVPTGTMVKTASVGSPVPPTNDPQPSILPTTEQRLNIRPRGIDPDGSVGRAPSSNRSTQLVWSTNSYVSADLLVGSIPEAYEDTNIQMHKVMGEIRGQEEGNDVEEEVSKISNSFETASTGRKLGRLWRKLIGAKNMMKLLRLDEKAKNKIIHNLTLFWDAADTNKQVKAFAQEEIAWCTKAMVKEGAVSELPKAAALHIVDASPEAKAYTTPPTSPQEPSKDVSSSE